MQGVIGMLVIGLAAGWIAAQLMSSKRGVVGMLLLGVLGAFVGGLMIRLVGFEANSLLAQLITATLGAVVSIWVLRKI